MNNIWLTTEEAAKHLGIGKTKLYALSQSGKIPVSKVGKKWLYNKDELDAWLKGSKAITSFFMDVPAKIEDNFNLREPQRDAYLAAYEYFNNKGVQKVILQLPVGCGKSGLASILPFGISKGRVLVITPNLTIKDELKNTLDVSNRQKCFWRRMGVLADKDMAGGASYY